MGTVFEAIDQRLDTTVALKETLFADEKLSRQFEREARLLARLHHPALPRVSDHFSEADGQFLVMQYIAGDDLAEMIERRKGPFPEAQVMSWADQLLDALDYLHTQDPQIIHRDIKPQNLKLTSRGQIILLDFGLAKGQGSEVSRVTTAASIFGYTPNYAPLEQVQGLGTDPRSDIYALSATLYHLLTGTKPPDALTRAGAIVNAQPDPLRPANSVNPEVSAETSRVLEKAMSQNREQRYTSAADMRQELKADGRTLTVSHRSEANTVLFPAVAAGLAGTTEHNLNQPTLAASTTPITAMPAETTVVRPLVSSQRSRRSPLIAVAVVAGLLLVGALGLFAYQQSKNSSSVGIPAEPSPTSSPVQSGTPEQAATEPLAQPAATASTEPASTASAVATKKEKTSATKDKTAAAGTVTKTPKTEPEHDPEVEASVPDPPEIEPPNVPARRVRRQPGGTTVRTLPDGTQMVTSPDGTRVVIRPDGTRRVFGAPRRRVPPKY
jgi:serine/threonine protein kinase